MDDLFKNNKKAYNEVVKAFEETIAKGGTEIKKK
jgi:hypothetical protein